MLSGVLRLIANRLLLPRLLPKRTRSQAPFLHRSYPASSVVRACPTPDLAATQVVAFGVATPARSGLPRCVVLPYQRAVPTTPADPNGCTYPVSFPVRCSLPRYTGGSASASLLSRPAQASLTLRPVNSLSRMGDFAHAVEFSGTNHVRKACPRESGIAPAIVACGDNFARD